MIQVEDYKHQVHAAEKFQGSELLFHTRKELPQVFMPLFCL